MNRSDRRKTDSRPPAPVGGGVARFLEHHRLVRAAAVGLLAALAAVAAQESGWLERLELASYDARVRSAASGGQCDDIVVVDYDQATVETMSRLRNWDRFGLWPRSAHRRLLEYLERGKPRLVAFDVLFSRSGGEEDDVEFAETCARQGNVIVACVLFSSVRDAEAARKLYADLPEEEAARLSLGPADARSPAAEMTGATWPYPELLRSVRAVGSIQLEDDPDGVMRAVSPAVTHRGRLWPTLSTAVATARTGERPGTAPGRFELGARRFALDGAGRRTIRWYGPGTGPGARYRAFPVLDLYASEEELQAGRQPRIDPAVFSDRIVLVASNAAGSYDLRQTPFGSEPGVYIHAAAVESLLRGDAVRRLGPAWDALAAALLALATALAFAFGRGWRAALTGSGAWLLLAGGWAAAGLWAYRTAGLWTGLAAPQTAAALSLAGSLLTGYLVEGRQARVLRRGLARFLSPEVLDAVSANLDDLRPGMGRRCQVSMMFCDVRGFTPMSEKLEPEQVVEILGVYLGAMTDVIMATGGTLSKYLGDGIMAFWGAPQAAPDHAVRAARAALAMVRAQEEVKLRLAAAGQPTFEIGIGLHAGPAVVGTVGSERRLEYTAIGDTVNLASRVESLTKDFGVRVVVTSDFAGELGGRFSLRELGAVKVKGRSADVKVLELQGEGDSVEEKA